MWAILIVFCLISAGLSLLIPPMFVMAIVLVAVSVVFIVKYPFAGLILYLVVFLMRPAELYPALEPLHMERLIGIAVLIISLIHHKWKSGKVYFPSDLGSKLMVVFMMMILFTWTYTFDSDATQLVFETFMKLVIFYILITYEVNTKKRFNIFLGTFVILIAVIAFLAFRDYYGGGRQFTAGIERAVGRTSAGGNPNTLAGTLATALPLVIVFYRYYRNVFVRLVAVGIIGLLLLMIVNTGSRSGLLTLMGAVGTMIFFSKYRTISAVAAIMGMLIGWTLLPDQYRQRYETMVNDDRGIEDVSSGRVSIWMNGLRMIVQRPLTGVGGGAFRAANASGNFGAPQDMQPHNLYIQLLAEYGLVGAAVWFILLGSTLRRLNRPRPPNTEASPDDNPELYDHNIWFDYMRQAIVASAVGLMISGIFGHSLYRYTWYLLFALTAMITKIYYEQLAPKQEPEPEAIEPVPETT